MSYLLAQEVRAYRSLAALKIKVVLGGLAVGCLLSSLSQAHVALNSPNGGEALLGGAEFTIEWRVAIEHNQIDWDLWYSTESDEGPWLEIAVDLAKGNTAADSVHTFDWNIPNVDVPAAWVRVRQDNAGQDYFGISETSFSIAAMLGGADFTGDGSVDAADLAAWNLGYGATSGAEPVNGDADLDADVDGSDFLAWQSEFQGANAAAVSQSVPEPRASVMLLLGIIVLLSLQR
ncbi:MAG: hypothetical protein GXP24_09390 [Planctomycetes bacterium]|nr:hypothetical protein [Planctomycetota bacterium]